MTAMIRAAMASGWTQDGTAFRVCSSAMTLASCTRMSFQIAASGSRWVTVQGDDGTQQTLARVFGAGELVEEPFETLEVANIQVEALRRVHLWAADHLRSGRRRRAENHDVVRRARKPEAEEVDIEG